MPIYLRHYFSIPSVLWLAARWQGADLFTGVKIQGRFKSANVPVLPVSHDRWPHWRAAEKQRPDLIEAVTQAWQEVAS